MELSKSIRKLTVGRFKKLLRPPNTDGIGTCLQQPGQISNQLDKSKRSDLIQLIKFSVP